jgi:hypothetical protein
VIARLTDAWDALWFTGSAPQRMAAFRIAFGTYLFAYWAVLEPHVEVYFSNLGVQAPYLVPDYAPSPAVASLLFFATWALIALFTIGLWTRLVTPLLLASYLHHYFLQLAVKQSTFERLIIVYLVIACFADCAARWSVRAWRHPERMPVIVPIWPERLLRFQTVILYLGSGLWKLAIPAWRDGSLLWGTLQSMWATPLAFQLVRALDAEWHWRLLSWTVMVGEVLLALLLCFKRTRNLACVLGSAFHLANCVLLVVPEFLVAATPYVLFWRAAVLDGRGRRGGRSARLAATSS